MQPVSFPEPFLSEGGKQRHFGSEFIDLCFDTFGNFENMNDFLVLEVPDGVIEVLDGVLDKLLTFFGVDEVPFARCPILTVFDPIVRDEP